MVGKLHLVRSLESRIMVQAFFFGEFEFAHKGFMIGQFDLRNLKTCNTYLRGVENIIQLSARGPGGVRGLTGAVGIF